MLQLIFNINTECNMACTYCYEHNKHTSNKLLSLDNAKDLIDNVLNYYNNEKTFLDGFLQEWVKEDRGIWLDFIGGEVTLHIDLVEQICDYFFSQCANRGLIDLLVNSIIALETNGTTFFLPKVRKFFLKYKEKLGVPISIDGCKECHDKCRVYKNGKGTFDDVDKALKQLIKDTGQAPNSKITLSKDTIKYITENCKYLYSLGYRFTRMNLDITTKIDKETSELYYKELCRAVDWIIDNKIEFLPSLFTYNFNGENRKSNCGMTGAQLAIDYKGNLYNCFQFSDAGLDKPKPIGSIVTKKLNKHFIKKWNKDRDRIIGHNNKKCKNCPICSVCEECPVTNYEYNHNWFKSWNNCGETVAEAKAQLYLLKRVKETNYPYFHEWLDNVENTYTDNFKYLIDYEWEKQLKKNKRKENL